MLSASVSNCYLVPTRLSSFRNKEIKSKEGTTQGDPMTMAAFAFGVTPLIHFLHNYVSINNHICKEVAFADNVTIAGKIHFTKNEVFREGFLHFLCSDRRI